MPAQELEKIVVVQTAFAGDLILTLPMIQIFKRNYPNALIDLVVIPKTSELLANHPSINELIIFDKKSKHSGLKGLYRTIKKLRYGNYDLAVVPHRSIRSAMLVRFAGIKKRIGFNKSAGRFLFTDVIRYKQFQHEIDRNNSLLKAVSIKVENKEYPQLYPSFHDKKKVGLFLSENKIQHVHSIVGIAPGSVWNTKRWLKERFIELAEKIVRRGLHVILIGGADDADLCKEIQNAVPTKHVYSSAGKFSFLQSAELIQRCRVLVTNDSAPLHIATAMRTPIVAIFGATSPEFGFGPYNEDDVVIQAGGLKCKPCSIHGGKKCPVATFDCMKNISSKDVFEKVMSILNRGDIPKLDHIHANQDNKNKSL